MWQNGQNYLKNTINEYSKLSNKLGKIPRKKRNEEIGNTKIGFSEF